MKIVVIISKIATSTILQFQTNMTLTNISLFSE